MANFSNRRDREEMQELLRMYSNLKKGQRAIFIDEDDFERIINHYNEREELSKAMEAAELGLSQFPYSAQMMYKKADLLIAMRQYHEAMDLLQAGELFDANDITLFILKTDVYLALDQPGKAAQLLQEAMQLFDGEDKIDLLFELADVYDDYEDFEKVFDCFRMILEVDPTNEEALMKICFWADFTGRCAESIELHQQIIEEHPFCELAWFNLATAYQGIKLYEKAIDAYQYALAIDEQFDIAYRNMGDAFIRLRRYKEAIECLLKVIELCRPEEVIHEAIGHCFHKLNNFKEARIHYRKASDLNPDDTRILYKIAVTYCKEAQWEKAIQQLEIAMRVYHMQPEYNLLMGECKMEQGKIKEAIAFFLNATKAKPKNVNGHDALIRCLVKAEQYVDALAFAKHAEELTQGSPLFIYYQSGILFLLGKSKEAALLLEKALQINPRLFSKLSELVPGLLQRGQVVDLLNTYLRRKVRT